MILVTDINKQEFSSLLHRFGLNLTWVSLAKPIPGSFWGDPEAGLINNQLYVSTETPLHSAMHEACHYICMDDNRRNLLHTTSGGDYDEENAVCYLQIILADYITGFNRDQMCGDMDDWGYSFRLGSAKQWFEQDANDARDWLINNGLIDKNEKPCWMLRQ